MTSLLVGALAEAGTRTKYTLLISSKSKLIRADVPRTPVKYG